MSEYAAKCSTLDSNTLICKEIKYRRDIASCITSLALSVGATIGSAGASLPLTIPTGAYNAYKINSYKHKLKIIRQELTRRHLSPVQMRKRDILIPVAFTYAADVVSLGLAGIVDVVPFGMECFMESQVASAVGFEPGSTGLGGLGNQIEAELLNQAMSTFAHPLMTPRPPPMPAWYNGPWVPQIHYAPSPPLPFPQPTTYYHY
ncbi:hypothetical protein RhiJN_14913 [Ceratobasidium sp. AG-Ba]|nr:hypothetical protein RhiJN_14913 [Ceratobasidium sp. AG-Ba]QRW15453.1 hypothetical protein RhiLY_14452 [Ceratobasidium sp. AG-Ba]